MDEVERVIQRFHAPGSESSVAAKLDVLLDLERLDDPRVLDFLLLVLADRLESRDVRIFVLRRVRNGRLTASARPHVAAVLLDVLGGESSVDLRLQAALALGEFTDVSEVVAALGALACAKDEPLDLRYAGFTALDRAIPSPTYRALLHRLAEDETLGPAARSRLATWPPRGV